MAVAVRDSILHHVGKCLFGYLPTLLGSVYAGSSYVVRVSQR